MTVALPAAAQEELDPGESSGGDGPSPPPPDAQLATALVPFAMLELAAPAATQFVIHGTVPLPQSAYLANPSQIPFAVLDYDGSPVASQVEVVTWYPDAAGDGASVVEILARVRKDPATAAGARVRYGVVALPHNPPPPPGSAGIEDLTLGTFNVPATVKGLLANPASILVAAEDVFGNVYFAEPLDDDHAVRTRYGFARSGVRTYSTMVPAYPKSGPEASLPHLFGVHSYLSTVLGTDVLLMDLRLHNGPANTEASALDDPLGDVYFDSLNVLVPTGWVVLQDVSDPFLAPPFAQGAYNVYPLVRPLPGGKLHLLPSQGQFHRRLAITRAGNLARAQALLDHEGLAYCVPETGTGALYCSWWSASTPRYFPQSHRLPRLDHLGLAALRTQLASEYAHLRSLVQTGAKETVGGTQPGGVYPVKSGVLGWAHPYGVSVGGMVGGDEIVFFEGVREVCAASNEGYRQLELQHRMQADRMPISLWHSTGRPAELEDYVVTTGPGAPYMPFVWFNGGFVTGTDVIGLNTTPDFQRAAVAALGLAPAYAAELAGFAPHDYQHYVRYTRAPKFLAWIGNDPLAKDDLRLAAESFHLSYHEFPQQTGAAQSAGLLEDELEVAADPGRGFSYGRGDAWGLDAVNAAYALSGDPAWRAGIRAWSERIIDVLELGQSTESGIVQSKTSQKQFQSKYRFRQSIEAAIGDNAWLGLERTVWDGVSALHSARLAQVIRDSCYGMIADISWWPGVHAPWAHVPLGPANGDASTQWGSLAELVANLPLACSTSECLDGHSDFQDDYQIGSSLAYGYELTGDLAFLSYALKHTKNPLPGQSLLGKLEQDGTKYLQNRAALLALAQQLEGP